MSRPIRKAYVGGIGFVASVGIASLGVAVGVSLGVVGSIILGVVGGVVGGGIGIGIGDVIIVGDARRRHRGWQAPARVSAVSAPTSLRLVRGLLPGDEGAAWWAEVNSCLTEAVDPGERRRYLGSYRREVPQLIWTSWAEHLSASDRRELS